MHFPQKATIVEVGPRDGIQNINKFIKTEDKINLINNLSETGLKRIEVTSFVHPKAIPQMKDAVEVYQQIKKKKDVRYCVLVPNETGARLALEAGVRELTFVLSASESHNQSNVRKTITESLKEFANIKKLCLEYDAWLRGSIATAFGCPFEGVVKLQQVKDIAKELVDSGAREINLCDTTGMGNPVLVTRVLEGVSEVIGDLNLAVHFHNTRGAGIANILTALAHGVSTIETSIGGLGGCPFAPGATGNVATEDLVNLLTDMGIETGINLDSLINCANDFQSCTDVKLGEHVLFAGPTFSSNDCKCN